MPLRSLRLLAAVLFPNLAVAAPGPETSTTDPDAVATDAPTPDESSAPSAQAPPSESSPSSTSAPAEPSATPPEAADPVAPPPTPAEPGTTSPTTPPPLDEEPPLTSPLAPGPDATTSVEPVPEEAITPVFDVPTSRPETSPPSNRKTLPPPRNRGTGMFVAAAIVGTIGSAYKLAGTIRSIHEVRTNTDPLCPIDWCGWDELIGHSVVGTPLLIAGAGLLGGGMGMRGRYRAHEELFGNVPAHRKPTGRMPLRERLGWGLAGGGVGLWAVSRVVGYWGCSTEACTIGLWESTYYLSGAAIAAGMVLGPYATAHRRYSKRYESLARQTSLMPVVSSQYAGLSLSGRF